MLKAIVSILLAIVEPVVSFFVFIIEAIAGLFLAAGETMTAAEAVLVFFLLIFELIFWGILWVIEISKSIIHWRKPKRVSKPVIWRPKKSTKKETTPTIQDP